jgi:hypothetical protein
VHDSLGKSRAQETAKYLHELNPDVELVEGIHAVRDLPTQLDRSFQTFFLFPLSSSFLPQKFPNAISVIFCYVLDHGALFRPSHFSVSLVFTFPRLGLVFCCVTE